MAEVMPTAMPHTMKDRIWARIEDLGPGKAFMAKDFLDIASRGSIDVALASLTSAGKIRRIRRGLSAGAPGYQTTVGRRDPATARSGVSKALENGPIRVFSGRAR